MNCDVLIPVRLGNSRLPGKALKKINGKEVILYLVERLKLCKNIRNVIICTTSLPSDDTLVDLLINKKIDFFRGSEKDILNRFLEASEKYKTDIIINVDGDDIYTDPLYVDQMAQDFVNTNVDYIDMIGFPFGFRSVGFSKNALKKICELKDTNNTETGYRDYFTTVDIFKIFNMHYNYIEFPKDIRLSLDYEEDLQLAKIIFNKLGNNFHLSDIIELFKNNPELLKITSNLEEKWEQHYKNNLTNFSLKKNDKNE
ncbi:MAG: acylneuraminate cytidylyltransferase [Nitrosarchaeum sp.]